MHFLPYGRQTIDDDDIAAVATALRGHYLTTGPTVEMYECAFAEASGAAHAVACNSGTAALHLAALALQIGPGDAVIVPTVTFLATANVVRMCGAEVVFADVDPDTGLMTQATLRQALSAVPDGLTPRAAFPVHLNGQLCDMEKLREVANDCGLHVVEDACHALGVDSIGATAFSEMACFSTHAVKAIATGEGGVITTKNAAMAEALKRLRSHGMIRDPAQFRAVDLGFDSDVANPWYYEMHDIGWNYRLPDVLCALGISQLAKLDGFLQRRRQIAALYDELLRPLAPAIRPISHGNMPHGWHLYALLIDFSLLGITRRKVMQALRSDGIGSQVHYLPVHLQPYYFNRYGNLRLPGAEAYYSRCLSIPIYPEMTDDDVSRVAIALRKLCRRV